MQPVESLQAFSALINQARREHYPVTTNCYLLANEVERIIAQKRLFAMPISCGAAFLVDEGAFYRLYYYLRVGSMPVWDPPLKPVVLEVLYREAEKPAAATAAEDAWQACGFLRRMVFRQMVLRPASASEMIHEGLNHAEVRLHQNGLRLAPATPEQLPAVVELWAHHLDPYGFTYLGDASLMATAEQRRLWCVLDGTDTIRAVMLFTLERSGSTVQHLAVDEAFRRLGLGTALALRWLSSALEYTVNTCYCWISMRNTPSLELFRKLGFSASGRMSAQYLYQR